MKKRAFIGIGDVITAVILLTVSLLPLLIYDLSQKSAASLAGLYFNGCLFLVCLLAEKKRHPYSIGMMVWIFSYFFMFFAPLVQYLTGIYPWKGALTNDEIRQGNTLILLFSVCCIAGQYLAGKIRFTWGNKKKDKNGAPFLTRGFSLSWRYELLFTGISLLLAGYSVMKTGISGIVVSRDQSVDVFYTGGNSAVKLIVDAFIPAFLAYAAAEAAQKFANTRRDMLRFVIQFLCLLVCFFPTSIPRYKMAAIYGTVFLVLLPSVKKNSRFFWLFTAAMFCVFPVFSDLRHELSNENIIRTFSDGILSSFAEEDYDAYRMLISAVRYTESHGITWGTQLLGVFLFFVPRSLWPGKPGGSGAMLITAEQGADVFSNVSCPFIGEGLVNFGIAGIVLFGLLFGYTAEKADNMYWKQDKNRKSSFSPYLFFLFMTFFIMRGDLMSSFAYTAGFLVSGAILTKASN